MSDGMASNGLKFTKFLGNRSGGVRDSMHTHTHTHTHHITSHHVDPIRLLFTVRKEQ